VTGEIHAIRQHLEQVNELRAARERDEGLARRVAAVKRHQHLRFGGDYARLMQSPRYRDAARFFLDDLYGPADFADRDTQFGRVVRAMARVLPSEVMHTVAQLAELHALSECLDQRMAQALTLEAVDERSYRSAWQVVGRRNQREAQLELLLAIGMALEHHTRSPLLGATLRMMRRPAKAAGLAQLQSFLERGLAAFSAMRGAREFLEIVTANERRVIDEMFASAQMKNPVE
jgi:hypothetical protein